MNNRLHITKGGFAYLEEMKDERWLSISKYFDLMTGYISIPENVWDANPNMMLEALVLMKFGRTFDRDGNELKHNHWCMEFSQFYDDNRPELGNDAWFVVFRETSY